MSTPLPAHDLPEERIAGTYPGVRRYLSALVEQYRPRHARLHPAVARLIDRGRRDPNEFALPLLVHAVITGAPEPAVPIAAAHALWWRAANTFDDITDGEALGRLYGLDRGAALTAALECGHALPLRALSELDVPEAVRSRLIADYFRGCTDAIDGQLGDLGNRPAEVDPSEVMATYAHKSGAVYGMACAMAARLAAGTGPAEIDPWRRFGQLLGLLAQFRNDADDLRSGRYEDLRNGTATYLLVHLLHSAPESRSSALALLERAGGSAGHRRELAARMLHPDVLRPYEDHVARLAGEARALLASLAADSPFAGPLRARIDAAVAPLS